MYVLYIYFWFFFFSISDGGKRRRIKKKIYEIHVGNVAKTKKGYTVVIISKFQQWLKSRVRGIIAGCTPYLRI